MSNDDASELDDLFSAIRGCISIAKKVRGVAFRSVGTKYCTELDIVSGAGASYYGARWNPRGLRAVYASLDPATAAKEAYQEFFLNAIPRSRIMPRVFVGISFKLKSVLDLTESKIRRRLGFSLNDLLTEDWRTLQENGEESWTQAIGRGASSAGFEGILVPSAQDRNGTNIVIFPGNLARSGAIELMGKDQLPKHP